MPVLLHLDPDERDAGFYYTSDSEIFAMYNGGLAMACIIRIVSWTDHIKKSAAENRVRTAILERQLCRSKREFVGNLNSEYNLFAVNPFPDAEFD